MGERLRPSPRATERAIARCIRKAQRKGLAVVFNAKIVPDDGDVRGVCAMGAYEHLGRRAPRLRLPSSSRALCRGYDAIEAGFDGNVTKRTDLPRTWIEVGLRLRERFRPIDADELRRQIEVEEQERAVAVRINFTEPSDAPG